MMRWFKLAVLETCALILGGALPGVTMANAEEGAGVLQAEIVELEKSANALNLKQPTVTLNKEQLAAHRLVDAQVLYNLKDYSRAAILLMDYVHRYKDAAGYPDAIFYLADALFHRGDYQSAKFYFEQIVNQQKDKHYEDSLLRLVELSWKVGNDEQVKSYLNLLAAIPPNDLKPQVPYVRGKYFFFNGKNDEALAAFRSLSPDQGYYKQAQYFIGTTLVRKNEYDAAAEVYKALVALQPKNDDEAHVIHLSHLALGRLFYQGGKIKEAIVEYQKVPRASKEYDTALYEIAWAYVKAEQMEKALEALDVFVLSQPKSNLMPDVRVLQGNLLIRLQKWGRATRLFSETRDEFIPVHQRMNQVIEEHRDPAVFFDALLAENFGDLSITVQIPEIAVHWVKEDSNVKKAMGLVLDLREILSTIEESNQVINRLERAISAPGRIRMFPALESAKTSALEVENRLAVSRARVVQAARAIIYEIASAAERSQLEQAAQQRVRVEREIFRLPTTAGDYKARIRAQEKELEQMLAELHQGEIQLKQLRAQLTATEKYFSGSAHAKNEAARQSFKESSMGLQQNLVALESELDQLRESIAVAKEASGIGGFREMEETQIRRSLRELVRQEQQLFLSLRSRLNGEQGTRFDQLAALLRRCDDIDATVERFSQTLEENVHLQLSEVRMAINEEKQRMTQYVAEVAQRRGETNQVAGTIAHGGFQRVAKRLYDIVVRADVGMIDVAWALKEAKSKELSKLVRQRKMDLKVLDDEFRDILGQKE